jgi:hypothetical protein
MNGLLSKVRMISGPVSVHVFDLEREGARPPNRLYLFGDEHFSYDNLCSPCVSTEGCTSIVAFIRSAAKAAEAAGVSLDVFMEMPYVMPKGGVRKALLTEMDQLMAKDPGPKVQGVQAIINRVLGVNPVYTGVFSLLYKEYRDRLYDDDLKKTATDSLVRFHYCDARWEPHVRKLLQSRASWLSEHVPTVEKLQALLHGFLFSRDFAGDVRRVFGNLDLIDPNALSVLSKEQGGMGLPVHKIAKQFLRLQDGPVKLAVQQYLEDRVSEVAQVLRDDVGYGMVPTQDDNEAIPGWLQYIRQVNARTHEQNLAITMELGVWVLLMDAYLLCRLLRFATQRPDTDGGTSIVYVGDAHAEYYVRLLRDYMRIAPRICRARSSHPSQPSHPKAASTPTSTSTSMRCVHMSPHPCPLLTPALRRPKKK